MALTDREKEYAKIFLYYYSPECQHSPTDPQKIDDFIYGDENGKRELLRAFVTDVMLPESQVEKNRLTNLVAKTSSRVTELDTYSKQGGGRV